MKYHLFEVFGIELEYMLVKNYSLKVNPVVDQLLTLKNGYLASDVENGKIEWSNELVAHVVEIKTNGPTEDLEELDLLFAENVKEINALLAGLDTKLLPTAAHPLMQPKIETQLWKHSYSKIYALYNRIFDCRGHGWSNVQSMHINLPFYDDKEFEKLHAAVRFLLPIIPALSASSPVFNGKFSGSRDGRLEFYKTNQKEIPQMTGKVIPEQVFTKEEYHERIFAPIIAAIKPHDTEYILDHHFLNSRGAIARFDRNAIEIRVIDIQECPAADLAVAILLIESLKLLVNEEFISLECQKDWHEDELYEIFDTVIKDAEATIITNEKYLKIFGFKENSKAKDLWWKFYERAKPAISPKHQKNIEFLLENGSLASRILKNLDPDFSEKKILDTYTDLAECLAQNKFFKG